MARLTLSTLFAATLATSALAWTPEVVTTANLGGSVTAISLANAVSGGGPKSSISLPIDTVEACLKGCADFRNGLGCNTVNFCNNADGCGSGCNQRELGPYGTLQCTSDGKFPYKVGDAILGYMLVRSTRCGRARFRRCGAGQKKVNACPVGRARFS